MTTANEQDIASRIPHAGFYGSHLAVLIAVFGFSRFLYGFFFGLRFNAETLNYYNQYLDPVLLRGSLFQSLWYLKEQMPGFNLFLGIVIQLFPVSYKIAFPLIFAVLSLAT